MHLTCMAPGMQAEQILVANYNLDHFNVRRMGKRSGTSCRFYTGGFYSHISISVIPYGEAYLKLFSKTFCE